MSKNPNKILGRIATSLAFAGVNAMDGNTDEHIQNLLDALKDTHKLQAVLLADLKAMMFRSSALHSQRAQDEEAAAGE